MELDNPATEPSNAPLNQDGAAAAFAAMLSDEPKKDEAAVESKADEPQAATDEPQPDKAAEDDPTVTIKVDGKDVEVKLSELKAGYQRTADYTRKTQAVAEERKGVDAERQKVLAERQTYTQNLARFQAQLEGALQEQSKTDWQALLRSDPVAYLEQQHLAQTRQAQLQQVQQETARVQAIAQAEAKQAYEAHIADQQRVLLAKLPEWSDAGKANADKAALREYLANEGYDADAINSIADARAVMLARKAMLYDRMVEKASAAAKKVATLPTKVEKPGTGESPHLDRRSSAFQRLSKTGKVEDAAAAFASLL